MRREKAGVGGGRGYGEVDIILINLILCSVLGVLFYVVEVRLKRGINIFISLVKKR